MSCIVVVDDDPSVRELLRMYLVKSGFEVQEADCGAKGLEAIAQHGPCLVVLDIMMPEMDGYETFRRIRASHDVPVIFLTCRDDDVDTIVGLELGADDYIAKPFNPREVVARVRAVLRRTQVGATAHTDCVAVGDVVVDRAAREAHVSGRCVRLTPKEFDILCLFVSRPRVVLTRAQIMNQVWGYDFDYADVRTVDTHVKRLRRKLADAGATGCTIEAVWGTGYRLVVSPPAEE